MPKKVLLIESDAAFARETSDSLEAKGFQVRVTGDGKEGLDLAQEQRPDAIVLCVELPKMSGYSVIQKLKKDEGLKTIPVVLTSAEATSDTFEAHKKLKARAEEYLLKPFEPSVLAGKLSALLGLPEDAGDGEEEEVVALEEELALDTLGEADEELPSLESPEPIGEAEARPDDDEDLRLLDDAFQTLSGSTATSAKPAAKATPEPLPPLEAPVSHDELAAAAASLPDDEVPSSPQGLQGLPDEADALLDALAPETRELDERPQEEEKLEPLDDIPIPPEPAPAPPPAIRPASAQVLRAAGIPLLDPDTAPAPAPTRSARERSKAGGWDDIDAPLRTEPVARAPIAPAPIPPPASTRFEPRNDKTAAELAERKAEIDRLQSKLDALLGSTRKLDADLRASKEEARKAAERAGTAQAESTSLRERLQAAQHEADEKSRESADLSGHVEALANEAERLRTEAEKLRTELVVARGEAEGARNELERRSLEAEQHIAGLSQQSADLERQNAELEQRLRETEQRLAEASQQHADLAQQHEALEQQHADLAQQNSELSQQHSDLAQQHAELERVRADLAQQQAELERRLQEGEERLGELSQQNTRNEERVVKAYQKIKNDEKLREKIRKALSVAMQLLDETGPADPPEKGARPQPRE